MRCDERTFVSTLRPPTMHGDSPTHTVLSERLLPQPRDREIPALAYTDNCLCALTKRKNHAKRTNWKKFFAKIGPITVTEARARDPWHIYLRQFVKVLSADCFYGARKWGTCMSAASYHNDSSGRDAREVVLQKYRSTVYCLIEKTWHNAELIKPFT